MKRLMLYICALCVVSTAVAQRYDYDDIYFNPKKDIQKSTDNRLQSTDNETNYIFFYTNSYTCGIVYDFV